MRHTFPRSIWLWFAVVLFADAARAALEAADAEVPWPGCDRTPTLPRA